MPNDLASFLRAGMQLKKDATGRLELSPSAKGEVRPLKTPRSPAGTQGKEVGRLVLPYPPSVNVMFSFNRKTGRRFKSPEYRAYGEAVLPLIQHLKPLEGDVSFSMWLYRPRKAGDISNHFKVVEDVLQGYAYHNDKQIAEEHGYRLDDPENPRVEVLIRPV